MLVLLRRVALRHLLGSPFRALLIVLGVALGVALQIATRATSNGVGVAFDQMVEQLSGKADATVVAPADGLSNDLTADLADIPGVEHASALVEIHVKDVEGGQPLLILGVDFIGDPFFLPFDVKGGSEDVVKDPLAFVNDPHAILVSRTLANRKHLEVGGELRLTTADGPTPFKVKGIVEDTGPAAAFDGQVLVMFLDAAQVAFARGDRVDRIELGFAENAGKEAVLEKVRAAVGERGVVELPAERHARFLKLLAPLHAVLGLAGILVLVVAMFLTYNAVSVAVSQRRVEIGIIRALGATRTAILSLFCLEALALAVPAGLLGVVLGKGLAKVAMDQTLPSLTATQALPLHPPPPTIDAKLALEALLTGILATLFAAFIPALRAARVDPAITMRSGSAVDAERGTAKGKMAVAGLVLAALLVASLRFHALNVGVLAAVAVLLVVVLLTPAAVASFEWLGRPAWAPLVVTLGFTSVTRDTKRSAISVIALSTSVCLSVTNGIWTESTKHAVTAWFDRTVAADLSVTAGSPLNDQFNIPFEEGALAKVTGVPGVAAALPYRSYNQPMAGLEVVVMGTDVRTYKAQLDRSERSWTTVDGEPWTVDRLVAEQRVSISESLARRLKKAPGDSIDLKMPSGIVPFVVDQVVKGTFMDRPSMILDRAWLGTLAKDTSIDSIDLIVTPGARIDTVAAEVRNRLGGGDALYVYRSGELKGHLLGVVDQSFGYARSIEWLSLVVALMGVTGTMLAVVLDRRRELGVQRALGATRRQVALVIAAEAAALGIAATALGVTCGALQGFIVLRGIVAPAAEWDLSFVLPPLTMLRVAVLVVGCSVLAALVPAYRASRVEVTRALGYE
jgi:putative ABC transport system permease protein